MNSPVVTGTALRGEDLVLGYGPSTVVHGAGLSLQHGEVTALVGPNGSGKSTMLRALARLHRVDAGQILLAGAADGAERPVRDFSGRQFARAVTLFSQTRGAPEGLSIEEVVAFGRHPYRRRFAGLSGEDRAAIARALDATGLTELAGRAAGELSGGELQRVWMAVCLAQETPVLLLDEPTNHLDLRHQVETLDLVRDLADRRRAAVGIVLHDLGQAAELADTLVLMHQGRVHAAGAPLDVLTADNLEAVYGLKVDVTLDGSGRLRIDPVRRNRRRLRPLPIPAAH